MKKNKKEKKRMKHYYLFKFISLSLIILTFIFLFMVFKMDILGWNLIIPLLIIIFVIESLILFVLNKRFKIVIKIPFAVLSVILSILFVFGIYNLNIATEFVVNLISNGKKEEIYNIYVLNDSKYESLSDLSKKVVGIYNNGSDTIEIATKNLKEKINFKKEEHYNDLEEQLKDIENKKLDAIFISASLEEVMSEQYGNIFYNLRVIDTITVSFSEMINTSKIKVTKEPFIVYMSGIDTYGSIRTVSRSDVNILIGVNPITNKILLVNTPRDYYVKLHSKKAYDKLTHAGIYGVDESMNTLGDLYDVKVDFYLKANFNSIIDLVDKIGGITVESKYNFSYDGYDFTKGTNNLDGKGALAFSRFRKTLPYGDASRGENQEAVIVGLIEKLTNPKNLKNYKDILETISKGLVTNMSENDIYSIIKYQLSKNPDWDIEIKNAKGKDAYKTTYSAGKAKLYVMEPVEESLDEVKATIKNFMDNEE